MMFSINSHSPLIVPVKRSHLIFLEFELKTVLMNCQMLFLTRWLEILRGEKHLAIIRKKLPLYSMHVFFNQKWKKHNVVSCRKWIFK